MRAVRSSGTELEQLLRDAMSHQGWTFETANQDLPGKPDFVFRDRCIAVFVDGDFWHGAQWRLRGLSRLEDQFASNADYWIAKIRRNMVRDQIVGERLSAAGWTVLRFPESEIRSDLSGAVERVQTALESSRTTSEAR
jgi:DNA mismatch endonuclease, patch repair protein